MGDQETTVTPPIYVLQRRGKRIDDEFYRWYSKL